MAIRVDGLPPQLLQAAVYPENDALVNQLPYAQEFRRAVKRFKQRTGREIVLPNIKKYFFEEGVVAENMFSTTLTLSSASWAVIDTGQPSIIKTHGTFSRDTCYARSHLDGFRDTLEAIQHRGGKTSAVWNLDQIGVSLMLDAFDLNRTWTSLQGYYRTGVRDFLGNLSLYFLTTGRPPSQAPEIAREHVKHLTTWIEWTELGQEFAAQQAAEKILEKDVTGRERYDYLSPYISQVDHQQHVDPHPENLLHWLVKLDTMVGRIFSAVERSQRRDDTVVAMFSDHGSEIRPGVTAASLPITRVFRTRLFGGHTVRTLMGEDVWRSLSNSMPGIDYPRVYESDFSPYGKRVNPRFGEDDYATAFIDNFGNGRSEIHLRNNDLNRLHLLLLELKKRPIPAERFTRIKTLFKQAHERARAWLEKDLMLYEDYRQGALDLAAHLDKKADYYSRDSAYRLRAEAERDAQQLPALRNLMAINFTDPQNKRYFDTLFSRDFAISDYIPKKFLGKANTVYQLSHYTVGLDPQLDWIETTVDHKGWTQPMNYFEIMSRFEVANPPANGEKNPFDFMVTSIPAESIQKALEDRGLIAVATPMTSVIWVKSTARDNLTRGGEALILVAADGRIKYAPITNLAQEEDGPFRFTPSAEKDPFGLLRDKEFHPGHGQTPQAWLSAFHDTQEWLYSLYRTEYAITVVNLADIGTNHADRFIESEEFQKYLIYFSSDEMKQKYLRGLERKYRNLTPDLLVWSNELWNFNSKGRHGGGSHAGLRPIVSRTTFAVWGGARTGIRKGQVVPDVHTTLDITPTLFKALDMLDDRHQVRCRTGSIPERPFHPFPGRVVDLWEKSMSVQNDKPGKPNAQNNTPSNSH